MHREERLRQGQAVLMWEAIVCPAAPYPRIQNLSPVRQGSGNHPS